MEDIKRKIEIHLETTEECLENFNLDKELIELLEQDNALFNEVLDYLDKEKKLVLPTDSETIAWYEDNIGTSEFSASSAIYKFRLWLNDLNK